MKVAVLTALALIFASSIAYSQIDAEMARDHVVIKYSPLPMFDTDNTIQFGVEVPFGKSRFSIQEDLGYGHSDFNVWYYDNDNPPNKQTFKSRTQLRYYFYERRRVRAYVAGEYLFKKVVYRENQWVAMDCSGFGGCGYVENKDFKIARTANAGHVRVGWHFYFTNRLTMDIFTGVGSGISGSNR